MAKKKSDSEDGEKGSRLRIVVVVLAILLVAAGVYMYLGNGSADAPAGAQPVVVAAIDKGEVIKLEPIFINLKDDRFLKVGLALQTTLTGDDVELDGHSIGFEELLKRKDVVKEVGWNEEEARRSVLATHVRNVCAVYGAVAHDHNVGGDYGIRVS